MICPAYTNEKMEYIYGKLGALGSLLKCTGCSLYFIWPNLFSTGNAQVYDKRYYDKWSLNELGYAGLFEMKQATFRDPKALIGKCKELLAQRGLLAILTPGMDSLSRKCMGRNWHNFKEEHLVFFSKRNAARILNIYYIISQIRIYNGKILRFLAKIFDILPSSFKKINFNIHQGEMLSLAQKNKGIDLK